MVKCARDSVFGMDPGLVVVRGGERLLGANELLTPARELLLRIGQRAAPAGLLVGVRREEHVDRLRARTDRRHLVVQPPQARGPCRKHGIEVCQAPELVDRAFVHDSILSSGRTPVPMRAFVEIGFFLPSRRAAVFDRAVASRVTLSKLALGGLVVVSIVARTGAAWLRATPNYFPDEGIYAALSRSIAHGHLPAVRGHVAHFPALLQPIMTAPAWWFGSLETGYRLTQLIQAVAISTAAPAVWWAARRLGVGRGLAFAAAALALAVPDVGYSGWVLSEAFAYPLFIAAVGAGMVALAQPTKRAQGAFLAFALLASFARMQLAVLVLAYLLAAVLLRRFREQRIVIGGVALAAVVALAGGLGYYKQAPSAFHLVSLGAVGRNALVLAYAAGWIIVPAGLLGLAGAFARPRTELERAFGALALTSSLAVFGETTLYGYSNLTYERYGCYLFPLLFLGFVLHAGRGWPWRRVCALLAAGMFLVSAIVPLSGWAAAGRNAHSLFLTGLLEVQSLVGSPGDGALLVAAVAAVLSLVSILCTWKRRGAYVMAALGVAFCLAASVFATRFDVRNSRNVKASFLPAGADWIKGDATVVSGGGRTSALEQFFWNSGAKRLALLPGATQPDVFAASLTHVTSTGGLAGVTGQVVLDQSGGALVPVQPERFNGSWLSARSPHLAAQANGLADGWFSPSGRIQVYRPGTLSFVVTAPEAMTLRIAGRTLHLSPAVPAQLHLCATGPYRYAFSSHGYLGYRLVSARATFPTWVPTRTCGKSGGGRIRTSVG